MNEKKYIECEAAIDALTEQNLVVHMDSVNDGLVASCHRSAQRIIANLPAADVRPVRRGKWSIVYDDFMKSNYNTCSCCGKEYFGANGFNFCPNCGADMRGSNNEQAC